MDCTNPVASFFVALSFFLMLALDASAADATKTKKASAARKPAQAAATKQNAAPVKKAAPAAKAAPAKKTAAPAAKTTAPAEVKPSAPAPVAQPAPVKQAAPAPQPAAPAPTPAPVVATAPAAPVQRSIFQKSWGIGFMSWSETVQVTDKNNNTADARTQMYTPSFHYAWRENRANDGILYEAYGFYGKADIQSEDTTLIYFQKRVSLYGLGGSAGWYWRPESKQVNLGVSVPLQLRHIDWTNPPGGGGVNKKDQFNLGLMLDLRWRMTPDLAINQRVGTFFGIKGSLWMANLEWTL